MKTVDLNCDLGEGAGHDGELMPLISSANIACGAHAGDHSTMREAVMLAPEHGVKVGAHPGFADRANFGRCELALADHELRDLILRQVEALRKMTVLHHVKLHGALYNLAAREARVAAVVADAIKSFDPALVVYALAGSQLVNAAQTRGLLVAQEVFADRRYRSDGALVSRADSGALITRSTDAVGQILRMLQEGVVRSTEGIDVRIRADTVCVHGDGPHAVEFAKELARALQANGFTIGPRSHPIRAASGA